MPQIYGITAQAAPATATDGTQKQLRVNRYGDQFVTPVGTWGGNLCSEGTYFRATNPTFGTGIAMSIQTTWSATKPLLVIRNTSGSATGATLYLDYIRLICTAAGSSTTSSDLGMEIEAANRYTSGGTQLTPACANTGFTTSTIADLRFGVVTAASAGSNRQIGRMTIKTQASPCWIVGDNVFINFGSNSGGLGALSGAAANLLTMDCGPVALGPNTNHSFLLHMWNTSNASTAPSWEVEVGWWER